MTPSESLVPQSTSSREIAELFGRFDVAERDARLEQRSPDGRYVDAYTAGFLLAKIVVRASGFRVRSGDNHRDTFSAVPWLMGTAEQATVDALDGARRKRNADLYDGAGFVDDEDVAALLRRVTSFEAAVRQWLGEQHPELTSP
jgi:hypothetical protein